MLKALLRTGDIKDYTVLGQEGITVHSVASQLRNTIKLKRGQHFADYLAIPQRNDKGNQIDWYVPFDSDSNDGQYLIIPWTSATEEEREKALVELQVFEREMLALGREVRATKDLRGDQRLFSRLLCGGDPDNLNDENNLTALRFPNPEHVYIVNNRPVITFWGFSERGTPIKGSPFLQLRPVQTDPPSAMPAPPVSESVPWYRRFWWLIPLLLLLLLLPFLLRSCPSPTLPTEPKLPATLPEKALPTYTDNGIPYYHKDGRWYSPDGTAVTDSNLLNNLNNAADKAKNETEPATNAAPVDEADTKPLEETATDNTAPKTEPAKEEATNEPQKNEPPKNEQAAEPDTNLNEGTANVAKSNPKNTPLNIPQGDALNGNVDFLNGRWKAGAGIQDKTTGKPLQLNYEFSKGQGKVKISRGDGIQCTGDVTAAMANGELNINNAQIAQCTDGTTYQLPEVKCKAGDEKRADCQGKYGQEQQFPMSIKSN